MATSPFPPPLAAAAPPPARGWRGWSRARKWAVVGGAAVTAVALLGSIAGTPDDEPATGAAAPSDVRVTATTAVQRSSDPARAVEVAPAAEGAGAVDEGPDQAFRQWLLTSDVLDRTDRIADMMGEASEAAQTFDVQRASGLAFAVGLMLSDMARDAEQFDGELAGAFHGVWTQCADAWLAASDSIGSLDGARLEASTVDINECNDGIARLSELIAP